MIPVTQKASNVCAYCRIRKQRCDRMLPKCSRCASNFRHCDYTPVQTTSRNVELDIDTFVALFLHEGTNSCGPDLSPRGKSELLDAVSTRINQDPVSTNRFSELVYDILDLADVSIPAMLDEFVSCIHQWCPIIDEDLLREEANDLSGVERRDRLCAPLILLCIFLVTRPTCRHRECVGISVLYSTMKQMLTITQTTGHVYLELFQAQMLLAIYECGHGMVKQAYITLNSCVAMFNLIGLDVRKRKGEGCEEALISLEASVIMLDSMIPLSNISDPAPLTCPIGHPISQVLASSLAPTIPPPSPKPFATSPRKVHIRGVVALVSGQVLHYIHALRYGLHLAETYDEVDDAVSKVIKMLVDKPQPHTWLHCDAIAMAFCSHLLLQQAQIRCLRTSPSLTKPDLKKAEAALYYSRRMAWDMVRVAIQKMQTESEVPHLPFAGLCCVIRAAVAVLETREYEDQDSISVEEISELMSILEWFAGRWGIGIEYLSQVRDLSHFSRSLSSL